MDGWRVDFSCFVSHNKVVAPPMDDVLAVFSCRWRPRREREREKQLFNVFLYMCHIGEKKKKIKAEYVTAQHHIIHTFSLLSNSNSQFKEWGVTRRMFFVDELISLWSLFCCPRQSRWADMLQTVVLAPRSVSTHTKTNLFILHPLQTTNTMIDVNLLHSTPVILEL